MGAVTLAGLSLACSSVPELRFDAPPADGSADTSTDGGLDARANDATPTVACPGEAGKGAICCGSKLCVGCDMTDCTECAALATCLGTELAACCGHPKAKDPVTCEPAATCK